MTTYAQARIKNPARYFETPDHVLKDDKLSRDEKVKVLQSMALDADQMVETTSEGMAGANLVYSANDLQSALIKLEEVAEPQIASHSSPRNARFQKIMVVTTVNQDLNRAIADVAFSMAEITGGKVFLLSVVPSAFEGSGMVAAGPMGMAIPPAPTDKKQDTSDRHELLVELRDENSSGVRTGIEVRSGQIEEVIMEYAGDCDADVIVVGSPNRSWLEALLEPSIAHRVTKSASCPVLIVPEQI
ncbi:MAG: nucleotide-binding universal stress UspA family protein [Yoonia sp.]|jgi:nucleotide-binding universal stress UspA family protein